MAGSFREGAGPGDAPPPTPTPLLAQYLSLDPLAWGPADPNHQHWRHAELRRALAADEQRPGQQALADPRQRRRLHGQGRGEGQVAAGSHPQARQVQTISQGNSPSMGASYITLAARHPYEQAISIIGGKLSKFDEDDLILCFGFRDESIHDQDVFCFYPDERSCNGFSEALERYRELIPHLPLAHLCTDRRDGYDHCGAKWWAIPRSVDNCRWAVKIIIGAFKPPCDISITFSDARTRKQKDNGKATVVPVFQSLETISGEAANPELLAAANPELLASLNGPVGTTQASAIRNGSWLEPWRIMHYPQRLVAGAVADNALSTTACGWSRGG
ncbi:hypothetical protein ACP70R_022682 [Stipagrostis hirtigluma subsp. patula]